MKNIIKNLSLCCAAAAALCACTEKYDTYNLENSGLNFVYDTDTYGNVVDSAKRYTFVYRKADVTRDTVWVKMQTRGFLYDEDRIFELEQVQATGKDAHSKDIPDDAQLANAEPDVHYVSFNDPEIKPWLKVEAGKNMVEFPLILKRDASLQNQKTYLKFQIRPNGNFMGSYEKDRYFVIEMSDMLVQPKEWTYTLDYYFAGGYGPEKFRFMIDHATWQIDDKWFSTNFGDPQTIDMGYTGYLSTFFTNALIEENRARRDRGEEVLTEADGTIVQFTLYNEPQPYI